MTNFIFVLLFKIDNHIVGCGDRTVSMWDHRNGNLLIDMEIDIPTIGRNLGCYTLGAEVSKSFQCMTNKNCVYFFIA